MAVCFEDDYSWHETVSIDQASPVLELEVVAGTGAGGLNLYLYYRVMGLALLGLHPDWSACTDLALLVLITWEPVGAGFPLHLNLHFAPTDHMEIIFAVSAVVAESITAVVASITIEKAMGVFRPRKESQSVVWMSRCGKDGWIVFSFWVKKKDDH
uniref:Uncharacterized protein n=1 Tax=Solanum lycopersicum TaxID=4081 RepID=A0A3Q7FN37_SOLLC